MIKYFCDRCGEQVDRDPRSDLPGVAFERGLSMFGKPEAVFKMLCPNCRESLRVWFEQPERSQK